MEPNEWNESTRMKRLSDLAARQGCSNEILNNGTTVQAMLTKP